MPSFKINHNIFYRIIFWGYLVLMGTTLKLTLDLTSISTILTTLLVTLPFLAIIFNLRKISLNGQDIFIIFVCCALLLSCFINVITHGMSYIGVVQTLSFTFPWTVLLCVAFSKEYILWSAPIFWKWFNNFIFALTFLGLLEYFAVFSLGFLPPVKETPNGTFFVGYTTIFHALESGIPHFRFYGPFGEPGDLAMWASVLIVYNALRRNYLVAVIFALAVVLSASPSAYISLLVALGFFVYKSRNVIAAFTLILLVLVLWYFFTEVVYFVDSILVRKETSLQTRVEKFVGFFENFRFLIVSHPFGIPFFETTFDARSSGLSFAGNFTPILAFERGGIVAFTAYSLLLTFALTVSFMKIVSSKKSLFSSEIYLYFLMIFPFVVQRHAVFEFGLFPILFSAIFLVCMKSKELGDGPRIPR